ncbi:zf-HC2 domain-containing protein [Silanimonas sp.]|uniref:zf-HC2 domain-containing protein n=1 Tax=Silanimonas sp. TaxID=1929290 RepID=UPI001BBD631B|nr:zf-HC2 domain-containing protein [Silanimonas sp.]MBS3896380.1 zf-HC2 domain-containing protein [Silanimonas sp.]
MTITPEQLYAYLDGELDAAGRAEVEAALAADPALAAELAAQRGLRRQLRGAYDPVLGEPMSQRLQAVTGETPATNVVDLADRRATPRRGWRIPATGWAVAATLALGVLLVPHLSPEAGLVGEVDGRLVAQGELRRALEEGRSGEHFGRVALGFGFRDRGGAYCRSFTLDETPARAGFSCRGPDAWTVEVLAEAVPQGGELRQAASLPPAVLAAIDARIEGEPLDAEAEAAALSAGWR